MSAQTRNIVVAPPAPPGGWATASGIVIAELTEPVYDSSQTPPQGEWGDREFAVVDPATGTAAVTVVCNDDPQIQPSGSAWKFWWVVNGQPGPVEPYVISTALPATVNLSSLTPAASTAPGAANSQAGPLANRPAATGSKAIYYATDDGPGTAWLDEAAGVW